MSRYLIDLLAIFVATAAGEYASGNFMTGFAYGVFVALYGYWCFCDGLQARKP